MKILSIVTAMLINLSCYAAQDYCVATKEKVPYTGRVLWTSMCAGAEISGWGKNDKVAEENLRSELAKRGYVVKGQFFDKWELVFGPADNLKEICLSKRVFNGVHGGGQGLDCGQGFKIVFDDRSISAVKNYASKQGYRVIRTLTVEDEERVILGK